MNNIDIFRLILFNVMNGIESKFPAYANFEYEDLLPEAICPDEDMRMEYCFNTMNLLKDNSYIKVMSEELPVHGWDMVLPTEKMLELMNITIVDKNGKTFGAAILEMGKNATTGAIQELMKDGLATAARVAPDLISSLFM